MALATKAGASAEALVTKVSGLSVSARLQEIENVEFTTMMVHWGFRLWATKGNASTSDLLKAQLKNAVEAALAIAKYTSPDDCTGLVRCDLMALVRLI